MEIRELDNNMYKEIVKTPFCRFNNAEFYALNAHKVDKVYYLIFSDEKDRFALVLGVKDGIAKAPFSASFECFSEISKNNKIRHYHDAMRCLLDWAKKNNISKITISLPPYYYNVSHITKMENALFVSGFVHKYLDVNFEYYLSDFGDDYDRVIPYASRKSLNKSLKNNLVFEKTDDTLAVYNIIKQNRIEKGHPLWMSYEDVVNTAKIIPSDFFLVKDENEKAVASALVHHINDKILRVVYWGNTQESNYLCPMNFLTYNIFKYYSKTQFEIMDIGISTEDSIPNCGLCDFKEGIGCKCSVKSIWEIEL